MVDFTQDGKRGRTGRLLGIGAVLAVILLGLLMVVGGGSPDLSPAGEGSGDAPAVADDTLPADPAGGSTASGN